MRVVVIDDCPADLKHFARVLLERHNADVLAVDSLASNLEIIAEHAPIMVLLDDQLGPLHKAEDSLRVISKCHASLPVVVMSGNVGPDRRADLIRLGAFECVDKDKLDTAMLDLLMAMASQRNLMLKRSTPRQPRGE